MSKSRNREQAALVIVAQCAGQHDLTADDIRESAIGTNNRWVARRYQARLLATQRLHAAGYTAQEIADALNIADRRSVFRLLAALCAKLGPQGGDTNSPPSPLPTH